MHYLGGNNAVHALIVIGVHEHVLPQRIEQFVAERVADPLHIPK